MGGTKRRKLEPEKAPSPPLPSRTPSRRVGSHPKASSEPANMVERKKVKTEDEAESSVVSLGKPGLRGLRNLGQTCFINVVLQALSATQQFRTYFLEWMKTNAPVRFKTFTLVKNSTMVCLDEVERRSSIGKSLVLCSKIHHILRVLWSDALEKSQSKALQPSAFVYAIWEHVSNLFENYEQQDASEFFEFLLTQLHEELQQRAPPSSVTSPAPPPPSPATQPATPSRSTKASRSIPPSSPPFSPIAPPDADFISSTFGGRLCFITICSLCKKRSDSEQNFFTLRLQLPSHIRSLAVPSRRPQRKARQTTSDLEDEDYHSCTLTDCFQETFSPETINDYKCSACRRVTNAMRETKISKLPEALVVVINRTSHSPKRGQPIKYGHHVNFPMENLDLSGYLAPKNSEVFNMTYSLSAVVIHDGLGNTLGHYRCVSLHSGEKKWFEFDDERVKFVPEPDVLQEIAYVLVYERSGESMQPPRKRKRT